MCSFKYYSCTVIEEKQIKTKPKITFPLSTQQNIFNLNNNKKIEHPSHVHVWILMWVGIGKIKNIKI